MKFKLEVDMTGSEFDYSPELKVVHILECIITDLTEGVTDGYVNDPNEDMIGYFEIAM